jgi:hypothetical protein
MAQPRWRDHEFSSLRLLEPIPLGPPADRSPGDEGACEVEQNAVKEEL